MKYCVFTERKVEFWVPEPWDPEPVAPAGYPGPPPHEPDFVAPAPEIPTAALLGMAAAAYALPKIMAFFQPKARRKVRRR